jgi:hypothetical protein
MNWQGLRRPQITLRVLFALTTLIAVGLWYYNWQRFEIDGDLSPADFAVIRQLVRSHEQLKGEPVVTLRVHGPNEVELTTQTQDSADKSHGYETMLNKKNATWEMDGLGSWTSVLNPPNPFVTNRAKAPSP